MSRDYAVDIDDIREAARRIEGHAHRTPIHTCRSLNERARAELLFKCENLQRVGAFKFRGACNAVLKLKDEVARRGVVTHSSGNHAQALALAASLRGIPAHVVMPSNASTVKRAAVEGYGGRVVECDPSLEARETVVAEVLRETGGVFIPPYNHPDIIAGQGTAASELLGQVPDLDAVIAPVGGGGLLAGTCIAVRSEHPTIKVYGAEPAGADDAARSLRAGALIPQTSPDTIADGLLTSLGDQTWPIIHDQVEDILTVPDEEIIEAMRLMWTRAKLIIEPSAAVALAAAFRLEGRIGVILSGGNVDLDRLPW